MIKFASLFNKFELVLMLNLNNFTFIVSLFRLLINEIYRIIKSNSLYFRET